MGEIKKNILITQDYNPIKGTGISVATFGIAKELSKLGCEVTFASYDTPEESSSQKVEGVNVVRLQTIDDLKKAISVTDTVINVLSFSAMFKPFAVTVGFICGEMNVRYIPWVHTTLQNSKFNNVVGINDYVQQTALYLTTEMLKGSLCPKIIAVSKAVKDSIVKLGIDPEKVMVIYNGLDTEKVLKDVKEIKEKTIDVICVQRLSAEKGNVLTLAVFANLKRIVPNFKGVIVGEGGEKDLMLSLIKVFGLENNVKIISNVINGELTKKIACSKAFLSTSLTESFGLAVAESMLIGTPVVVPNIEGPDELTESGECGFVYECGDTVNPAKILGNIILGSNKGPLDLMVEEAMKKAQKEFDVKKQAQLFFSC